MKHTFIVGLAGPGGAGKDTVAKLLQYPSIAFAGPLKAGLAAMGFPEPAERAMKEELVPGYSFTWRRAAQTLGTEWGRMMDPELWLNVAKQRHLAMTAPLMSVTDVRFHNEADWVREHGLLVHVTGRRTTVKEDHVGHASEHGLPAHSVDYTLNNSGEMSGLLVAVSQLHVVVAGMANAR